MNVPIRIAAAVLLAGLAGAQSKLVGVYKAKSELLRPAVIGELPDGGRFVAGNRLPFHETVPLSVELVPLKRHNEYGIKSTPKLPIRRFILPGLLRVTLDYGRHRKREHRWEVYEDEDTGGVAMRSQTGVVMNVRGNEVLFLDLDHDGAFGALTDGYVVKPRKKKQWFKYGEELDVRTMSIPYELEGDEVWFRIDPEGFSGIVSSDRPDYAVVGDADHAAALELLNARRKELGFRPVVIDPALSANCEKHSLYCAEHGETRKEMRGESAYTAEGARAGAASVMAEAKTMKEAVEYWLATFARRIDMLNPGLMTIGMALVNGHATMDVRTTLRSTKFEPYAWPHDGQEEVALTWTRGVKPSPVAGTPEFSDDVARGFGYPVTLTFPGGPVTDVKAAMFSGLGEVDCYVSTPEKPGHIEYDDNLWTVLLTARKPLEAKTRYRVVVTAHHDGKPFSKHWSFQTR